ncbi:hypothetical protein [Oscillibacter sp.]|uniref:hypothetical protein n=1 Tax=Oscillibacter sp. TaxID=1945593 RepID=UPI00289A2F24|nr:hypothetical protein [Oscillibacter sp.]
MSNIIPFSQPINDAEINIFQYRTTELLDTAQEVSEYINSLPLSNEQNDRLVWLLVENVAAAERSGFYGAFAYLAGHGGGAN